MKAVILAGGKGARLKPFTDALPKPMLPIGTKPFLEIQINHLKKFGFDEVILAISYMKGNIVHYFGDGKGLGIKISYSEEKTPLGTAGAIKKACHDLKETFVVLVGDGLADIDFHELVSFHKKAGAAGTMVVYDQALKMPYGLVNLDVDNDNTILGLEEKPNVRFTVNTGITVLEPGSLNYMKEGEFVRLPDLFLRLKAGGEKIVAYRHTGTWVDIGQNFDQYLRTNRQIMNREITFNPGLSNIIFEDIERKE
jgi:NDP-sugar pyrophosphorylase family protein